MAEPYPLPAYAASIWFTGDAISIAFPPQGPEAKGSTITIPLDRCGIETSGWGAPLPSQRGWAVILTFLKQRASAAREFKRLSDPGTPSQYEVERALASDAKYAAILGAMAQAKVASKEEKDAAAHELAELGL